VKTGKIVSSRLARRRWATRTCSPPLTPIRIESSTMKQRPANRSRPPPRSLATVYQPGDTLPRIQRIPRFTSHSTLRSRQIRQRFGCSGLLRCLWIPPNDQGPAKIHFLSMDVHGCPRMSTDVHASHSQSDAKSSKISFWVSFGLIWFGLVALSNAWSP